MDNNRFSKRLTASLLQRHETDQWTTLIARLLRRLELKLEDREKAEKEYEALADRIARKLDLPRHDVRIFPQGSMRTQTTISPQWPTKFDLDVVVHLEGPRYTAPDPEKMFEAFGKALEGHESLTGAPERKRRCWRLNYPNERFYFDVTPAVNDQTGLEGSSLSVRDPETRWSPSNPGEYANWFCERATKRFPFQSQLAKVALEARTQVDPLPDDEVGLDDILRRTVQLVKLHRDTIYRGAPAEKQAVMPISVIIVTLLTHAYEKLLAERAYEFHSPIEVVLELIEMMPSLVLLQGGKWYVRNPALPSENFADRWNDDFGAREREFRMWHKQLEHDLEALLHQSDRTPREDSIRSVFGPAGVEAWKASKPNVLNGLLSSAGPAATNPKAPMRAGSSNTLGSASGRGSNNTIG
jgi:hypothetical protein